jgi:hypothetical protein
VDKAQAPRQLQAPHAAQAQGGETVNTAKAVFKAVWQFFTKPKISYLELLIVSIMFKYHLLSLALLQLVAWMEGIK